MLTEKPCSKCKRVLPAEMFNKAKWLNSGLRPDCKECYSAWKKKYWAEQPKSEKALRREENRRLGLIGKRKCCRCAEIKPADTAHWVSIRGRLGNSCRVCDAKKTRDWAVDNATVYKANAAAGWAKRNAAKIRRTLELNAEHQRQLKEIYAECRRRNHSIPRAWHVDHIIPLKGKTVSGLHVPWNLQILPAQENVKKSNRIIENF